MKHDENMVIHWYDVVWWEYGYTFAFDGKENSMLFHMFTKNVVSLQLARIDYFAHWSHRYMFCQYKPCYVNPCPHNAWVSRPLLFAGAIGICGWITTQIYVENNKSNYYIYLYRDQYKLEYGNEEINILKNKENN